ncbi:MAG: flagellar assembly protein FliW [Planctomycetota bacterium]
MLIRTHRFGDLDVAEESVIHFPEGLVGLSQFKRFVLLEDPESPDLIWLQSADEPRFVLATIRASKLGQMYAVEIQDEDRKTLNLKDPEEAEAFVVLNRVEGKFYANLRGPVIVNIAEMLGKQIVLTNPAYGVRHPVDAVGQPHLATS